MFTFITRVTPIGFSTDVWSKMRVKSILSLHIQHLSDILKTFCTMAFHPSPLFIKGIVNIKKEQFWFSKWHLNGKFQSILSTQNIFHNSFNFLKLDFKFTSIYINNNYINYINTIHLRLSIIIKNQF